MQQFGRRPKGVIERQRLNDEYRHLRRLIANPKEPLCVRTLRRAAILRTILVSEGCRA